MKKLYINLVALFLINSAFAWHIHPCKVDSEEADSVKFYVGKGQTLWHQGKLEEGLQAFGKALKLQPDNEDALIGSMTINVQLGHADEGYKILENWTKLEPKNPKPWSYMMYFQSELGHADVALSIIDTLIALQPDSARNWIMKTNGLMESGKYNEALQASEKAIEISMLKDPKQASMTWYMNAYALAKLGRFDEAVISCNKGIDISPKSSYEGIYNRACIYSLKGDREKALADLKQAIETDPTTREQVKERARADGDFKSLYTDETFMKLTRSANKIEADNAGTKDSVCSILQKNYADKEFVQKVTGSWKAVRVYVHGQNALGNRDFYFTLKSDNTIIIEEPERNFHIKGTWKLSATDNTISWEMPEKNNSFIGRYDFLGKDLILSGRGFIGELENVCIRLKIQ